MCIYSGRRGLEVVCGLTPPGSTASGRKRTDVLRALCELGESLKRDLWFVLRFAGYEAMCCSLQQASNNAPVYALGWRDRLKPHNGTGKQDLPSVARGCQDRETLKLCHLVISELSARNIFFMWMGTLKWRHAVAQACVALAEGERVLCSRQGAEARFPRRLTPSLEKGVKQQLHNQRQSCLKRKDC